MFFIILYCTLVYDTRHTPYVATLTRYPGGQYQSYYMKTAVKIEIKLHIYILSYVFLFPFYLKGKCDFLLTLTAVHVTLATGIRNPEQADFPGPLHRPE